MNSKKIKTYLATMITLLLMISNTSFAQQGNPRCSPHCATPCAAGTAAPANSATPEKQSDYSQIPNLTTTQQESIHKIELKLNKQLLPLQNSLREKTAKLNTLSTAENPDSKAIDAQIDEISKVKTEIAKLNSKARQDIRALLDDEQKLYFDTHYRQVMHHKTRFMKGNKPRI